MDENLKVIELKNISGLEVIEDYNPGSNTLLYKLGHSGSNYLIIIVNEQFSRLLDEEGNELFEFESDNTIKQLKILIDLYRSTWRKAFNRGYERGKIDTEDKIKSVVAIFSAGWNSIPNELNYNPY